MLKETFEGHLAKYFDHCITFQRKKVRTAYGYIESVSS